MRAIMETSFDIIYLLTVIILGITMIVKSKGHKQYLLFGIMAVTLGLGDAFHLVPRAVALCTTGLESYAKALGIGKFITSITMTVFYILLYYVYKVRYEVKENKYLDITIYALSILRVGLCLFPQNNWLEGGNILLWSILRNIPFTILGIIIILLFYKSQKENSDKDFRFMWLTIVLSFGFYLPVVLFAHLNTWIGLLMIPKTCAYVWTVIIGYQAMKKSLN